MTQYSDETKAAAMAALLQGQSVSSVAKEYKIPKGTVSDWKRAAHAEVDGVAPAPTQKAQIHDLLIQYIEASLRALAAQAELFADRAWLQKQEASQLAVLHGVHTDKVVRLLEAMSGDGDAS